MTKKFSLTPDPHFNLNVGLPLPGADPVDVRFTFNHRGLKELARMTDELPKRPAVDVLMDILHGWELEDDFTRENVERLAQSYPAAPTVIWNAYFDALMGVR